jgi:hypothetical protein
LSARKKSNVCSAVRIALHTGTGESKVRLLLVMIHYLTAKTGTAVSGGSGF